MKLRNKLIPILSAATVAATVAPATLTSCSSAMVDLVNGYNPSIKKAVWEDYKSNRDDMLAFYASAVNENPEIFAQDMYWANATEQLWQMDYRGYLAGIAITPKTLSAKVSDVQIKKLTCFYTEEETRKSIDYYTISANFTLNLAYDAKGYNNGDFSGNAVSAIAFKNIPFMMNREEAEWFKGLPITATTYLRSFSQGYLPTDWALQPILYARWVKDEANKDPEMYLQIRDHSAFTNLENNGYEWSLSWKQDSTATYTSYATGEPETITQYEEFLLNKDSQFEKASKYNWYSETETEGMLEAYAVNELYDWFVPSHYLADIVNSGTEGKIRG